MLSPGPPLSTPFAALTAQSCPAYDEMLVGLEREFHAVDRARVADTLDELARPLFGLDAVPALERTAAVAQAARAALPDEGGDQQSWLVGVQEHRDPVVVDVGPARDRDPWGACVGCLCGHALAFVALGGLADAAQAAGRPETARRAAGLRLLLPLDEALLSAVRTDLARFRS